MLISVQEPCLNSAIHGNVLTEEKEEKPAESAGFFMCLNRSGYEQG